MLIYWLIYLNTHRKHCVLLFMKQACKCFVQLNSFKQFKTKTDFCFCFYRCVEFSLHITVVCKVFGGLFLGGGGGGGGLGCFFFFLNIGFMYQ